MKFVIQHNLMNNEQLLKVNNAIKNFPHIFVGLIPFSREITSDEPIDGDEYCPYGSTLLTNLAYENGWKGLYFDLKLFDYEVFTSNRTDMLNDFTVLTVEDAVQFMYKSTKDWFIRPVKDLKQFSGQVINSKSCHDWLLDAMECASSGSYQLDKKDKVVISPVRNIQAEWRYFIIDRKIVSGSMYRAHGQLRKQEELNEDVLKEAQSFADKWLPHECCVMDLALVDDEVKVIEFNCINSSGFYANNVDEIFNKLYEYNTK